MDAPSPYGSDHSLLHAVLVLLGGLDIVAVGAYLLTALDAPVSQRHRAQLAEGQEERPPGRAQRRAPSAMMSGAHSRAPGRASGGGGVPAWAESGDAALPPRARAPQGSYEIDPDFGAADLGAPSASAGAAPGGGTAVADAGGPTGGASSSGGVSTTPDLGGGSPGSATVGSGKKAWRSEARTLASRTRALSRELGRLDEGNRSDGTNASSASGRAPGEATTASGTGPSSTSNPGTPDDPDQVPLGGTEWLAAAGAAYALNRLRERESTDDESGEGSSGTG